MPATTLHPWPTVRQPFAGGAVRTVQYLLRHRGHDIAADSQFGPKTDAAVRAFQGAAHLVVDGIVGPRTWAALVVTIRRGSEGDAVHAVQHLLAFADPNAPSTPLFAVDGIFGPVTESFVRSAQTKAGIAVDGVVGPMTWQAIVSGMTAD